MKKILQELINDLRNNNIELLANKYREDINLDFKKCITFEKLTKLNKEKHIIENSKHEFAVDIASFANTNGGYLVFGVDENDRIPSKIIPFEIDSLEQLESSCAKLIRDRIEPQLYGCGFHAIDIQHNKFIFIVHIPKSLNAPHGVRKSGEDNYYFYSRNNEGNNYQLKLAEFKNNFILRDSMIKKMKEFKAERIEAIKTNKAPIMLFNNPKIIMHLLPISAFTNEEQFDTEILFNNSANLYPINSNHNANIIQRNFDGILIYDQASSKGHHYSYTQLHRNGIIESVNSSMITTWNPPGLDYVLYAMRPEIYEKSLIMALQRYMSGLMAMGITQPVYCAITFVGVKNYSIYYPYDIKVFNYLEKSVPVDRDILSLPEFIIEDLSNSNLAPDLLKNSFDLVHNACGMKESINYTKRSYLST